MGQDKTASEGRRQKGPGKMSQENGHSKSKNKKQTQMDGGIYTGSKEREGAQAGQQRKDAWVQRRQNVPLAEDRKPGNGPGQLTPCRRSGTLLHPGGR